MAAGSDARSVADGEREAVERSHSAGPLSRPPAPMSDDARLSAMLRAYFAADRPVMRLAASFRQADHTLYLVGGSVRDLLLERQSVDLDFTTDAHPDVTARFLNRSGATGIATVGVRFGTISGCLDGRHIEVTTYRSETYTAGDRHPDVTFGTSLEIDLARRDLTINAMAVDVLTGDLIDLHHGRHDLQTRLIRVVGTAADRFREDPLRLLRAVRLAAQLDFAIEPATAAAIRTMASELQTVSRERVRDELIKLLLTARPDWGIEQLSELRLLAWIAPPVEAMRGMVDPEKRRFKDLFAHTMKVLAGTPNDLVLRLAALLHDIGKPRTYSVADGQVHFFDHERVGAGMARRLLTDLRFDARTINDVVHLIELHMRPAADTDTWTDKAVRRFMVDATPAALPRLFALAQSDMTSSNLKKVRTHLDRLDRLRQRCDQLIEEASIVRPASPLDGVQLMERFGGKPGLWIGKVKQYLLDLVVDGELDEGDEKQAEALARAFILDQQLLPAVPPDGA